MDIRSTSMTYNDNSFNESEVVADGELILLTDFYTCFQSQSKVKTFESVIAKHVL